MSGFVFMLGNDVFYRGGSRFNKKCVWKLVNGGGNNKPIHDGHRAAKFPPGSVGESSIRTSQANNQCSIKIYSALVDACKTRKISYFDNNFYFFFA